MVTKSQRVVQELRDGRIVADGPKSELTTGPRLSNLFGVSVSVLQRDGHYDVY